MTTETLIKKVRDELGPLHLQSEQAVAAAMKILQNAQAESSVQTAEKKFVSRNITPEEYVALLPAERRRYFSEAKKQNHRWIENQFENLKAKWIMVIEGQVIKHSATLDDYPDDEEFETFCDKTGKYPFIFFNPLVFAIEELATTWHKTKASGDSYPALSITLSGNSNRFETRADLDTGAIDSYCSFELLKSRGVIKTYLKEPEYDSEHLSQPFVYRAKRVSLELVDNNGVGRQVKTTIICVNDWQSSPFIAINPNRTFLLGRSTLLKLQPRLILDFAAKHTEVQFAEAAS